MSQVFLQKGVPVRRIVLLSFIIVILTATALFMQQAGVHQASAAGTAQQEPLTPAGVEPYKWTLSLPSKNCFGSGLPDCQMSSPTLVDVDKDGHLDIVVGTNKGHVVVVKHNGQVMWDRDVTDFIPNMGPNSQEIHSSPAVADIDGDGHLEIVVGMGTINREVCTQGGMIVLDRWGNVKPGWPRFTTDWAVLPAGCTDSIVSSPVLGDMDNDGDLEIVAGGFDMRIYAWHHDGSYVSGYPPNSWLYERYPWSILVTHLADTVWASPALADIDGDGFLDVVISTDEGNQGDGWNCPYALPPGWRTGYCGGSLYVLDRFGQLIDPFPIHFLETVQSTPAIADLNGDGRPDIIVGSGTFYRNSSPDRPTYGFRVYAFDGDGNPLPGWEGGKATGGPVPASPAIGDIAGDSKPEVVVASTEDNKLYAWHHNGQPVAGFPVTPLDLFGQPVGSYNTGHSYVLADYDDDGKMEIIFNQGWVVTIIDGDGYQMTSPFFPNTDRPVYYTDGTLINTPAVGDIDNDGKLELVTNNSKLYVWDLESDNLDADWPMWKMNAAGNPRAPLPASLGSLSQQLVVFQDINEPGAIHTAITIQNLGDETMQWTSVLPNGVSLSPSSGSLSYGSQTIEVTISRSGLSPGFNNLGNIRINATSGGTPVAGSPLDISLTVFLGDVSNLYIPLANR